MPSCRFLALPGVLPPLSFSLPSPLLFPFSSFSYIKRLPVAFSLPSQDYSSSSDAFFPLKGFISARCLLASLQNTGSMLALCPLSKGHAPPFNSAHESYISETEVLSVINKGLSLWEDKFIASSDSLREMITRTEKERMCLPSLLLAQSWSGAEGSSEGILQLQAGLPLVWFWTIWALWGSFLAVPQPSLFYLLSYYFKQRGTGGIST